MEGFFYGVGGRVVEVYDVTNLVKDHETQFVATGFLVAMHQCEHVVERAAMPRRRQTQRSEQRAVIVNQILIDVTDQMGQLGGIHHTDGHRIAMPPAEVLELFDGMAHRVPVVEEFTKTLLLQIGGDVVDLDLYRALNELGNHVFERRAEECRAVESAQFSCVVFEDMQDFGIADETGFGDFAETLDEDVIG